jgi:acyl carrier protein
MTKDEAFNMIQEALDKVKPGSGAKLTAEAHLVDDGFVDSLDSMNFLFELENAHGGRLEQIDDTFSDFRVVRLIEILADA